MSTRVVAMRKFPKHAKTQYFRTETQKTQKMLIIRQNDWRDIGRPLSCNAFAIARFLASYAINTECYSLLEKVAIDAVLQLKAARPISRYLL